MNAINTRFITETVGIMVRDNGSMRKHNGTHTSSLVKHFKHLGLMSNEFFVFKGKELWRRLSF